MRSIDLFSGAGGFSIGFKKAGFNTIKAVEFDKTIANTYKKNNSEVKMYINDIRNIDIENEFSENESDIIIGGPPCQGFSMAGSRIRKDFIDDERNYLFKYYFKIVQKVKPKMFIMENVKGILTMHSGKIIEEIEKLFNNPKNFDGNKYFLNIKKVNAKDFGIPQNRERVIITGILNTKIDFEKEWQKTKEQIVLMNNNFFDEVTVWDAISNLDDATDDGIIKIKENKTNYQKYINLNRQNYVHNHIKTNHSLKAVERIKKISSNENYLVLDEKINSVHSGSYGRLDKNGIANTITTRFDTPSAGRYIHPLYDRTITPREAARLQSFPDDYIFYGTKTSIAKQIGNAVPPKLSYFLGIFTRRILNEYFN